MHISETEAVAAGSLLPEVVELAVALLLVDAVDDLRGVVGELRDLRELDQVQLDDQDSVLRVHGLVVGGKDPGIVADETVIAADHEVVIADDRVVVPDHDVVVLDQVALDGLQQRGHRHHLLVEREEHHPTLPRVLAVDLRRRPAKPPAKTGQSLELLEGLVALKEREGRVGGGGGREGGELQRVAVEVEVEGVLERSDGQVRLRDQRGVDVQSLKVVLPLQRANQTQEYHHCQQAHSFHYQKYYSTNLPLIVFFDINNRISKFIRFIQHFNWFDTLH